MDNLDVICIGAAIVDIPLQPVSKNIFDVDSYPLERIAMTTGGDAINEATIISRLGHRTALMNPLMILVKIIKLRWIHILSYDQMVSRKINNQTTRCANSIFYTTLFTNSAPNYT